LYETGLLVRDAGPELETIGPHFGWAHAMLAPGLAGMGLGQHCAMG